MKVIITGTTGMIGEGILSECLQNNEITEILSVSRKPTGKTHQKLKELIVNDFLSLPQNDPRFEGYDACFFCAGVSSLGMDQTLYEKLTYDTTLAFARALNPSEKISFIYVSGSGTDSSESGKLHWARVKGKTENDLMKLPFKKAYGFRIGLVKPAKGQNHALKFYKYVNWLFPILKYAAPNIFNTMNQIANAMIYITKNGYENNIIYVKDIRKMNVI